MQFAGTCLFVELLCLGAVKHRRALFGVEQEIQDFDDSGMTMTMEQVITQLQQEVFTLKTQVTDVSGLADAVRRRILRVSLT